MHDTTSPSEIERNARTSLRSARKQIVCNYDDGPLLRQKCGRDFFLVWLGETLVKGQHVPGYGQSGPPSSTEIYLQNNKKLPSKYLLTIDIVSLKRRLRDSS